MRERGGGGDGGKVCVVWCLDDKYRWYLYQLHCWLQCSLAHVPRFTLINDIKCWRNLNYIFRNIYFGRQEAGYWEKSLELWLVRYYATLHLTYLQLSLPVRAVMMMTASLEISGLIAGLQVRRGWCQLGRLCTESHEPPSHLQHTHHVGGGRRQEGGTTGTEEKAGLSSLHSNHQTLLAVDRSGLARLGLDKC